MWVRRVRWCCSSSSSSRVADVRRLYTSSAAARRLVHGTRASDVCAIVHTAASATALHTARRGIFADKVRPGMILKLDKKYYRVVGNTRAQKGQTAVSFNVALVDVLTKQRRDVKATQGHDFNDQRTERVRMLFSGFDDDDMACFVYPEYSSHAGTEVNLVADTLPEQQQKFLCCGMPVDLLHVLSENEDDETSGAGVWLDVAIPSSYTYTVEKIMMHGMYRMASLVECDGVVSVNDQVQPGDKIKVILKTDGTAAYAGKVA